MTHPQMGSSQSRISWPLIQCVWIKTHYQGDIRPVSPSSVFLSRDNPNYFIMKCFFYQRTEHGGLIAREAYTCRWQLRQNRTILMCVCKNRPSSVTWGFRWSAYKDHRILVRCEYVQSGKWWLFQHGVHPDCRPSVHIWRTTWCVQVVRYPNFFLGNGSR